MADEPVNRHDRIRRGLQRLATWPVAMLTVLAALLCQAGFQWRDSSIGRSRTPRHQAVVHA